MEKPAHPPQDPSPAICPRCGYWYSAGTRLCSVDGTSLILPDHMVRLFGPEDLSSTIATVVEVVVQSGEPCEIRPARWPRDRPKPYSFFEANTRPADSIHEEDTDHGAPRRSSLALRRRVVRGPPTRRRRR